MECKRLALWCVGEGKIWIKTLKGFFFFSFLVASFRRKMTRTVNLLLSTQISLNRRDPSGCGGNKAPRGNHPPTPSHGVSRNPFNDAWNMNEGQKSVENYSNFLQLAKSCNGEKYWQPNRSDNLSTPLFWETRLGTEFLRDIGNSSNLAPCPSTS